MTESILEEPEFLKELHRIREKLSTQTKQQTLENLKFLRKKYGADLHYVERRKTTHQPRKAGEE